MTTTKVPWASIAAQLRDVQPDLAYAENDENAGEYHPWMRPQYESEREQWEKAVNAVADFFAVVDTQFNRRAFELAAGYNTATSDGGTFR